MAYPEDGFFMGMQDVIRADSGALAAKDIAIRVRARRRVYERSTHREPPKYLRGWRSFGDGRLGGEDGTLCVANLARACDRIPDGAAVTVDGSSGRVQILGSA